MSGGPTSRNARNRGTAVIASARDRRIARQLLADAFGPLVEVDPAAPVPTDDDGEGLADVDDDDMATDALTPEEWEARDHFARMDARDCANYAEVAETTAAMRELLQRSFMAAAGLAVANDDDDCEAPRCVDCSVPTPHRTRNGTCAMCALAQLEGVDQMEVA